MHTAVKYPETLDVAEARRRLLDHFAPLGIEVLPLSQVAGRVLGRNILAEFDLPPFPNSAMDGFAVRAEDIVGADPDRPVSLDVVADIPAGQTVNIEVQADQAARIMTGAVIPTGADAVAPVEHTDYDRRESGTKAPNVVKVFTPFQSGAHIRSAGEDVRRGEVVLSAGQRIRPQEMGFMSMLGVSDVPVRTRPRVAVFSAGDELLPVEEPLVPGKIHDANSYSLIALVELCGGQAFNLGIVADAPEAVQDCLERCVSLDVDLILSSAGVSVGSLDFVRSVIEKDGRLNFWRVNMRPGKPLVFGHYKDVPFVGLPGNPVSAYVGFELFVRPALYMMQGRKEVLRPALKARLLAPVETDGRETYLRTIVSNDSGDLVARLTGHQGSGNLRSLVQANALVRIPPGVKSLPSGAQVDVWMLDE